LKQTPNKKRTEPKNKNKDKSKTMTERLIEFVEQRDWIATNDYFRLLSSPQLDAHSFWRSQLPFLSCVSEWTRALALLLAKTPQLSARTALVMNLADEHGHGEASKAHVSTFQQFCQFLKEHLEMKTTDISTSWSSEHACDQFNLHLQEYIRDHSWQEGMACLGAIEASYARVSEHIHRFVTRRFQTSDVPHYHEHTLLDSAHARELFVPLQNVDDPTSLINFQCACVVGLTLLEDLYTGLARDLYLIPVEEVVSL
jgi:pyrroloquinoline-quinone synthase